MLLNFSLFLHYCFFSTAFSSSLTLIFVLVVVVIIVLFIVIFISPSWYFYSLMFLSTILFFFVFNSFPCFYLCSFKIFFFSKHMLRISPNFCPSSSRFFFQKLFLHFQVIYALFILRLTARKPDSVSNYLRVFSNRMTCAYLDIRGPTNTKTNLVGKTL